jgi:putative SOS response-associated peptidase YedK
VAADPYDGPSTPWLKKADQEVLTLMKMFRQFFDHAMCCCVMSKFMEFCKTDPKYFLQLSRSPQYVVDAFLKSPHATQDLVDITLKVPE